MSDPPHTSHTPSRVGRWKMRIVVQPAATAQPAGQDPVEHHAIRNIDQQNRIDVVALEEKLGLATVSRKAIQDEPIVPIMLVEAADG